MIHQNDKLLPMKRMRSLTLLLFIFPFIGCSMGNDRVHWIPLMQGLTIQRESARPILFYFYSTHCMYCKLMEMNTFSDPGVAEKINTGFIPVKLDIEGKAGGEMPSGSALAAAFHISAVPALVVVNAAHRRLDWRVGFQGVRDTISFLVGTKKNKLSAKEVPGE